MERTIRVTGKGIISVKPDMIQLEIQSRGLCREYTDSIQRSAEETGLIREAIAKSGIDPKELKTVRFDVNSEYENYEDKNSNWRRRFAGYKYDHSMQIVFPNDNKILGKVLYELSVCPAKVEFSIRYTVKDAEAVKNAVLEKSVEDSRKKAVLLTKAAGVELGEIVTMDYSWGKVQFYSQTRNALMTCEDPLANGMGSFDIEVEADDIDVEDTVTVIWEIR